MKIYLNTVHSRQQQQKTLITIQLQIVHSGYVNRFRNYNNYQQKETNYTKLK